MNESTDIKNYRKPVRSQILNQFIKLVYRPIIKSIDFSRNISKLNRFGKVINIGSGSGGSRKGRALRDITLNGSVSIVKISNNRSLLYNHTTHEYKNSRGERCNSDGSTPRYISRRYRY